MQKQVDQNTKLMPEAAKLANDSNLKELIGKAASVVSQIDQAPKFKTAEELGITENQRESLIKTLADLEANKIEHSELEGLNIKPRGVKKFFNMRTWGATQECGTVACIKGWAVFNGGAFPRMTPNSKELNKLFFLGCETELEWMHAQGRADRATDQDGAKALRGYLETGKADWSHVFI